MSEVLEEPEGARGTETGLIVVDDDRRIRGHAAQVEQVIDHPHERLQRRRVGVDQRDAPQIEVDGAWDMTGGEILRRPKIDDE
jgi:hypothetical protein